MFRSQYMRPTVGTAPPQGYRANTLIRPGKHLNGELHTEQSARTRARADLQRATQLARQVDAGTDGTVCQFAAVDGNENSLVHAAGLLHAAP